MIFRDIGQYFSAGSWLEGTLEMGRRHEARDVGRGGGRDINELRIGRLPHRKEPAARAFFPLDTYVFSFSPGGHSDPSPISRLPTTRFFRSHLCFSFCKWLRMLSRVAKSGFVSIIVLTSMVYAENCS